MKLMNIALIIYVNLTSICNSPLSIALIRRLVRISD